MLIEWREGAARLLIEECCLSNPWRAEVFFNPAMALCQSLSSAALGAALPMLRGRRVIDGLCGVGVRGLRYALENEVESVVFIDASERAVERTRCNAELNGLRNYEVICDDLNDALAQCGGDVIELDPFGSPARFVENAIRKLSRRGILSVNATDLSALEGSQPAPCERNYGAQPLLFDCSKELALRILIGFIVRVAARWGRVAKPLISWYERNYLKTILFVEKSASGANAALRNIALFEGCFKCGARAFTQWPRGRCTCGAGLSVAGPLWGAQTCEKSFISSVKSICDNRGYAEAAAIKKLLNSLEQESDLPLYYDLHRLARIGAIAKIPRLEAVLQRLRDLGYKAARSHFSAVAIATNASIEAVKEAMQ